MKDLLTKLIHLGVVELNINGNTVYPESITRQEGYLVIDGDRYKSRDDIRVENINIKKIRSVFDSLKFILDNFDKDIEYVDFEEMYALSLLTQLSEKQNDMERMDILKEAMNIDGSIHLLLKPEPGTDGANQADPGYVLGDTIDEEVADEGEDYEEDEEDDMLAIPEVVQFIADPVFPVLGRAHEADEEVITINMGGRENVFADINLDEDIEEDGVLEDGVEEEVEENAYVPNGNDDFKQEELEGAAELLNKFLQSQEKQSNEEAEDEQINLDEIVDNLTRAVGNIENVTLEVVEEVNEAEDVDESPDDMDI